MSYFKHEQSLVADGASIGEGTRVWAFTNIEKGAVIGKNCNVCDGCFIEQGVVIGDNVTIKNHVALFEGVTVGDDVFIGANTTFINDRFPRSQRKEGWVLEKTDIENGVSIGSNVTVMCGVTVRSYALIGAGSVVTKDIERHRLVIGNPAREQGYACQCGKTLDQDLKCSCGLVYKQDRNGLFLNE